MKILCIGFVLMMTSTLQLEAQYAKTDSTYKRWFVGSTIFYWAIWLLQIPLTSLNSILAIGLQEKM
jgi:choline-glycine betaine transporter